MIEFLKTDSLVNSGFLLMIIGTILKIVYNNYLKLINFILNNVSYRLSFTSKSPIYYEFFEFFNSKCKSRNLTLTFNDRSRDTEAKNYLGPGYGLHFFFYEEKLIIVNLIQEKEKLEIIDRINLRIFTKDRSFLDSFLNYITSYLQLTSDKLTFYSFCNGSSWKKNTNIYKRPLASVILDKSLKEYIISNITNFINSKEAYVKLSIPHKRGYLLYGPPGTGKTTLVKAIASELNLPLYSIDLENLSSYAFGDLLNYLKSNSILLIEDIDRLQLDTQEGISLRQLLNIIDGLATPEHLLIFMTANNPEKLDKALIRTGRIDLKIHLDYATKAQIEEALNLLLTYKYDLHHLVNKLMAFIQTYNIKLTISDVQHFALLYNDDPEKALEIFTQSMLNSKSFNS